jgi:hypothetical protein
LHGKLESQSWSLFHFRGTNLGWGFASPGSSNQRNDSGTVRGPIEQNFAVSTHNLQMWVLTAKFCSIGPRTVPESLRLQTSPGEGILSAGDLKTERLQFQTVRRLKSEK